MAEIVVVGAGVIGLTTALCLAEAGASVQVWAADPPGRTTSAVAAALCGLVTTGPDDRETRWTLMSDAEFRSLAGDPRTGVRVARGRLVSNWGDELPPWATSVPGFADCTGSERAGYRVGFWAELPIVDMPRYLDYLVDRLTDAGVPIVSRRVRDLGEAAAAAPVVVNCAGTGARDLADDPTVVPVKGQHVVVANPGLDTFFYAGGAETVWAGYFPHGDRVVLGGVALTDDWSLEPDPAVTARILADCAAVEPRLAAAEVLGVQVGLRPGRPTVRVEAELRGPARWVHNYGHGSVGVSLSWGCAQEAAELALRR